MIGIQVTVSDSEVRSFLVGITGQITNRRELNEALAIRLKRELIAHFTDKNRKPNKMGGRKTEFWNKVADATDVLAGSITDDGATVQVAEERFNIHLFGGTILPVKAKALTIPLIEEAHGKSAATYQKDTGNRLFTIVGKRALFERTTTAPSSAETGLRGRVRRLNRNSKSIGLISRTGIRPVFALARQSTIKADPTALPAAAELLTALQEEADDFLNDLRKGGLA